LFLAIYGAVLSTILAIREITKERRRIILFLQYNQYSAQYSIACTNIGHRPITLIDIAISLTDHNSVPRDVIREIKNPFPVTLSDGENFSFILPLNLSGDIYKAKEKVSIALYDSEGKKYSRFKKVTHNEKYGTYKNTH
jgi:hypothetical protein